MPGGTAGTITDELNEEIEEDIGADNLIGWQQEQEEIQHIRHLFRRDALLEDLQYKQRIFDAELMILRHEKFFLDQNVKKAELRQLTLFQEYLLLKDFQM